MSYIRYVYNRINWLNKSESLTTPLGKTNLNRMDSAIYNIAENLDISYNEMSAGKLDKSDADKLIVGMPTWNSDTGVLTIHFYDGTTFQIDFNIEKIPVSFSMDSAGVITMTTSDGTEWTADIGDVIPTYTFTDSDTIAFSDTKNGDYEHTVSANVKRGSIKEEHLQPNYLADIKSQASSAKASADLAKGYEEDAAYDAKLAQSYAIGGSGIREGEASDNAKYYKEQSANSASSASSSASAASTKAGEASTSATNAANSASTAGTKASEAATSATNAANSAGTASTKASEAATSAASASSSATNAANSASTASTKASEASASATQAQNYAVGDTDSSKYYYEQAKNISESISGALRPMGTVVFANLPSLSSASEGDMYNISDKFTTTADFKEGAGHVIPAGANVYKTIDGKWDILAGSPVTGIKGNAESTYRTGDVNITAGDIGACAMYKQTVDLSDISIYDENTWYPVISQMPRGKGFHRIKCHVNLGQGVKPSWSVHNKGFSCNFDLLTIPCGWGEFIPDTIVLNYMSNFCEGGIMPVGYRQMNNSDIAVIFCRGGGRYYLFTDYETEWLVKTTKFENRGQSVEPQSSNPGIDACLSTVMANLDGTATNADKLNNYHATELPVSAPQQDALDAKMNITNGVAAGDVDWNTLTTPGTYKIENAIMDETHHAPVDEYPYGILLVLDSERNTGNHMLAQIYFPHSTRIGKYPIWTRMNYHPTSYNNWTAWTGMYGTNRGLEVQGRVYGEGDDEGIVVKPADNGYASITLGIYNERRSYFVLPPTNISTVPYWRYHDGSVSHTIYHPAKSGTIALTDLFHGGGTGGTGGYVAFAQLKIKQIYVNYPIEFTLVGRGRNAPCRVSIQFYASSDTDPAIQTFSYMGGSYRVFAQKTSASTWLLYCAKSEGWDYITVSEITISPQLGDKVEVTYPGTFITEKPTDAIDAMLGYNVGYADGAANADKVDGYHANDFMTLINANADNIYGLREIIHNLSNITGISFTDAYGHELSQQLPYTVIDDSFAPASYGYGITYFGFQKDEQNDFIETEIGGIIYRKGSNDFLRFKIVRSGTSFTTTAEVVNVQTGAVSHTETHTYQFSTNFPLLIKQEYFEDTPHFGVGNGRIFYSVSSNLDNAIGILSDISDKEQLIVKCYRVV